MNRPQASFPYFLGNQQVVKRLNLAAILKIIRERQPITQVDLSKATGLSQSTVSGVITELLGGGLVQKVCPETSRGGRRPTLLRLSMSKQIVGAISIRSKTTHLALLDFDGNILRRSSIRTETAVPGEFLHECALQLLQMVRQFPHHVLRAVGVTVPGLVDPQDGIVLCCAGLGWHNVPLAATISEVVHANVILENEASAIAVSELDYRSLDLSRDTFVVATFGDAVGTAVVIDKELVRGGKLRSLEFAHSAVLREGAPCVCGSSGCWEAYVSHQALSSKYDQLFRARKSNSTHKGTLEPIRDTSWIQVNNLAQLEWAYNTPDVWHFNIYRSEHADFRASSDSFIGSSGAPSFLDNTVLPGRTYFYRVSAVNHDDDESGCSAPLQVTVREVASAHFDDFSIDSRSRYSLGGDANAAWSEGRLRFGDNSDDQSDTVVFQGKHGDCEIQAAVTPTSVGIWDTVGVVVKVQDEENWFYGCIAYGSQLREQHSLALMRRVNTGRRDEEWLAFYPFSVEVGTEYHLKMMARDDVLALKAWKQGEAEPEHWMLSIPDTSRWQSGGVGLRHFGLGADVSLLSVTDLSATSVREQAVVKGGVSSLEEEAHVIVTKAEHHNETAADALRHVGQWIGTGLANIVNIVGVADIAIAGYPADGWPLLRAAVEGEIRRRLTATDRDQLNLVPVNLTDNALVVAAGSVAARHVLDSYGIRSLASLRKN